MVKRVKMVNNHQPISLFLQYYHTHFTNNNKNQIFSIFKYHRGKLNIVVTKKQARKKGKDHKV